MDNMISFKDFEKVTLKATSNMRIGNRDFLKGEVITRFDRIQIAGFKDNKDIIAARGGYNNKARVFWEDTKELNLSFSRGVFTNNQFALMTNSKVLTQQDTQVLISEHEELESGVTGYIELSHFPIGTVFIYDLNGELIKTGTFLQAIYIGEAYKTVSVDYNYNYSNNALIYQIGNSLINTYVELEGRTRVKDDTTGIVTTCIIKIPKLQLLSDLSIKLGESATPIMAYFKGIAIPTGERGEQYVCEFYFLEDDIDSDF